MEEKITSLSLKEKWRCVPNTCSTSLENRISGGICLTDAGSKVGCG